MNPIVFSAPSVEAILSRLQAMDRDSMRPTLAIVFCALSSQLEEVRSVFAAQGISLFGASSGSGFTQAGVSEGSIAAMLLDLPESSFQVGIFDGRSKAAAHTGRMVADWAQHLFNEPALLIIPSGLHYNGEQIIDEIMGVMERPIPLFGGFAGFQADTDQSFVFTTDQVIEKGIIALAFDRSAVDLEGVAASGWKGIGTPKTITRSNGNVIYEIDGAPALDMYNKYLKIGRDPTLAYEYPLLLLRNDGSSILRGSVMVNEDKSITYGGDVPQGAKVRFSIPPGLEITDRALDIVSQLKNRVPSADAVVLFSCKGRQYSLGPMVEDEISAIHRLWQAPLIGLFTDGEIGPVPMGRCDLHNHTLIPVIIRQKQEKWR